MQTAGRGSPCVARWKKASAGKHVRLEAPSAAWRTRLLGRSSSRAADRSGPTLASCLPLVARGCIGDIMRDQHLGQDRRAVTWEANHPVGPRPRTTWLWRARGGGSRTRGATCRRRPPSRRSPMRAVEYNCPSTRCTRVGHVSGAERCGHVLRPRAWFRSCRCCIQVSGGARGRGGFVRVPALIREDLHVGHSDALTAGGDGVDRGSTQQGTEPPNRTARHF